MVLLRSPLLLRSTPPPSPFFFVKTPPRLFLAPPSISTTDQAPPRAASPPPRLLQLRSLLLHFSKSAKLSSISSAARLQSSSISSVISLIPLLRFRSSRRPFQSHRKPSLSSPSSPSSVTFLLHSNHFRLHCSTIHLTADQPPSKLHPIRSSSTNSAPTTATDQVTAVHFSSSPLASHCHLLNHLPLLCSPPIRDKESSFLSKTCGSRPFSTISSVPSALAGIRRATPSPPLLPSSLAVHQAHRKLLRFAGNRLLQLKTRLLTQPGSADPRS